MPIPLHSILRLIQTEAPGEYTLDDISLAEPRWPEAPNILENARRLGYSGSVGTACPQRKRAMPCNSGEKSAVTPRNSREKSAVTVPSKRATNMAIREHLLRDDTINAALVGENLRMNGSIREAHTAEICNCKLGTGQSCCTNLWGSKATFQQHRIEFLNRTQETRTQSVFAMLKDSNYTDQDVTGQPVGDSRWHYSVNTDLGQRAVCKGVFLLAYPIGHATLTRIQRRIKSGCTMAHDKRDDEHIFKDKDERKSLGIIGWYIGYAESMGDWMPDSNELVVPRRDRQDEYEEYELALGDDAAAYSFFCRIIGTAPEVAHIVRARRLLNFQHCTKCDNLNAAVKAAHKSNDAQTIATARATRAAHHAEVRNERLEYYRNREKGRTSNDHLSLILDKWDSNKTTVPYFARPPGHWWTALKHEVLEQKVLGVLVHGLPNCHYFYTVNRTVSGGANLNIEGIRRTLVDLCRTRPLPRTLFIQADNASDNKCWTVLLFLAMLVYHGYTDDIYFSFLIVGHTHEDIDQVFSVLSRFLKQLGHVLDPQQFEAELREAMQKSAKATFSNVLSVLDWDTYLKPSLRKKVPEGIQHANFEEANQTKVPHTCWIHKRASDKRVVLHYKELAADPIWLPPLATGGGPLVTDPDGIELFEPGFEPKDPAQVAPQEKEFFAPRE
mgnify:FL=1